MPVIYKYPLKIVDEQTIFVPPGNFVPLCVQHQDGRLCLWARVKITKEPANLTVKVSVVGTGNPFALDPDSTYVGTSQGPEGGVWHVFVGKPK